MSTKELFEKEHIDSDFIERKFDGSYWESCAKFINENWNREIESMSAKQAAWLTRILYDCVEKRIEG
ncbi:MAG: hypothetical protein KDD61_06655 [Bdellovibrionales bacterium]|nr:hypothetical protein [Bdellovibrionales bacterium]